MSKIVESLTVSLEKAFDLSLLTHLHHWNVEGTAFLSVHKLLESNYEQLNITIDAVAERIRTLGSYVKPLKTSYTPVTIDFSKPSAERTKLQIEELIAVSNVLLSQLVSTRELAEAANDIGTVGLMDGIIPHLGKSIWFYESIIK